MRIEWVIQNLGILVVDSYENGKENKINYISGNAGVYDGIEDGKLDLMMGGLGDMLVGAVGIFTAGVETIGSGGFATSVAYAQFTFSVDEFMGGVDKFFDPKKYLENNTEAKPLKFIVGKYLGETGESLYTILDVTSGTGSIYEVAKNGMTGKNAVMEIIGTYDTASDAKDFVSESIKKDTKKKK